MADVVVLQVKICKH